MMSPTQLSTKPLIAIVVINWNGLDKTRRCVSSLLRLDYPARQICVIDNGSTDASVSELQCEFPAIEVLDLGANTGFAGGCNRGIEWARGIEARYVWLLNNDTTVDETCLAALVERAESSGSDEILAPKILRSQQTNEVWSVGGIVRWPWLEREHIRQVESSRNQVGQHPVAWASGCALFFSMNVADIIGPLDERYFLYLEDVDWCLRGRRKRVMTWVVPDAVIWHEVSATTNTLNSRIIRYYENRNYYLLAFSHCGPVGKLWAAGRIAITLLKTGLRVIVSPSHRRDDHYHAQTRAIFDFLRGQFGKAPYSDALTNADAELAKQAPKSHEIAT
jgi:GT2 family glycosyltransferase